MQNFTGSFCPQLRYRQIDEPKKIKFRSLVLFSSKSHFCPPSFCQFRYRPIPPASALFRILIAIDDQICLCCCRLLLIILRKFERKGVSDSENAVRQCIQNIFNEAETFFSDNGSFFFDVCAFPSPFGDLSFAGDEAVHLEAAIFLCDILEAIDCREILSVVPPLDRLLCLEFSDESSDNQYSRMITYAPEKAKCRFMTGFTGHFSAKSTLHECDGQILLNGSVTTAPQLKPKYHRRTLLNRIMGVCLSMIPLLIEIVLATTSRLMSVFRREINQTIEEGHFPETVVSFAFVKVDGAVSIAWARPTV
jgi:hypothetical protein